MPVEIRFRFHRHAGEIRRGRHHALGHRCEAAALEALHPVKHFFPIRKVPRDPVGDFHAANRARVLLGVITIDFFLFARRHELRRGRSAIVLRHGFLHLLHQRLRTAGRNFHVVFLVVHDRCSVARGGVGDRADLR